GGKRNRVRRVRTENFASFFADAQGCGATGVFLKWPFARRKVAPLMPRLYVPLLLDRFSRFARDSQAPPCRRRAHRFVVQAGPLTSIRVFGGPLALGRRFRRCA